MEKSSSLNNNYVDSDLVEEESNDMNSSKLTLI